MKKKIIRSILAILLISCIIGGTFAWFYINESTYVDFGSDITCEAGESLEISDDGGVTWAGSINKSGFSSSMIDITGDGKNFFRPLEIDENATPVDFIEAVPVNEEGVGEYVEFSLMFRSASEMNVYLSGDSYILPTDPEKKGNIFGNFSRDYIAGATRVSFENGGAVKMIWAPNPNYELSPIDNGRYSFIENGTPENTYFYTKYDGNNYIKSAFTAGDFATSSFVTGSTNANATTGGNSAKLFSLTPSDESFAIQTLTLRIWFEGTDREAMEALSGGKVKIRLKFTGIEKEDNAVGQGEIDAITYNGDTIIGLKDKMNFSFDGQSWIEYSSTAPNLPELSGHSAIYFRYPETNTFFRTTVKEILLS